MRMNERTGFAVLVGEGGGCVSGIQGADKTSVRQMSHVVRRGVESVTSS